MDLRFILSSSEIAAIRSASARHSMTPAEWASLVIREALDCESAAHSASKLDALRSALRHDFPTANIEQMLAEIAGSTR